MVVYSIILNFNIKKIVIYLFFKSILKNGDLFNYSHTATNYLIIFFILIFTFIILLITVFPHTNSMTFIAYKNLHRF